MKRRRTITAAAALAACGLALAAPVQAGSGKPQKKTVGITDNVYVPAKLTVNYGSTVTWKWPEDIGDSHDVKLENGPGGAKKFQSSAFASGGAVYKQRFTKPGKYHIICTFHETEMTMDITVRKKPKKR